MSLSQLLFDHLTILDPPERLSPSEASAKYVKIYKPGGYSGPYLNDQTPYIAEPIDCLQDRDKQAICFISSAQSGKTQGLTLNAAAYAIKVDPMDTIIYQTTQSRASDFSQAEVSRLIKHSADLKEQLLAGQSADTVHSKYFRGGQVLKLAWPAISEMSGKPAGLTILTDYDRMPLDVEGEGSPFYLASQRTKSYGRKGKTIVESSPGYPIPAGTIWVPKSAHEAPPCKGIAEIYNSGDRRRWYWRCPKCRYAFEPKFEHLRWPDTADAGEAGAVARMDCPRCAHQIPSSMRHALNLSARWLKDGQTWDDDGTIRGAGPVSPIASFYLPGVAAAFASWSNMVASWINAKKAFEASGEERTSVTVANQELGEWFQSQTLRSERTPEDLQSRAEDLPQAEVPDGVRFLVTFVDVQGNRFCVAVFGVVPAPMGYDLTIVDRFEIRKSPRRDRDGDPLVLDPAGYAEDWEVLVDQVLQREYPVTGRPGLLMGVRRVFCDSGGRDGVTTKAYGFWKRLVQEGLHHRFTLTKGDGHNITAPRAAIQYPDASKRDNKSPFRGDVPVLMLNSNLLKDDLAGMLARSEPGGGYIRFATWLPDSAYVELCVETRTLRGWVDSRRRRNEMLDQLYGVLGGLRWMEVHSWVWTKVPNWALPPTEGNSLVRAEQSETARLAPAAAKVHNAGTTSFASALAS